MQKGKLVMVLLGCAGLLLSGCTTATDSRQIRLALMGDQSFYELDPGIQNALDMAVEDCNTLYAAAGYSIQMTAYDDGSLYDKGVEIAAQLVKQQELTAILGTHNFMIVDMAAELVHQNDKLMVTLNGANDKITDGRYAAIFNNVFNAQQSGGAIAAYITQARPQSKIAIYSSSVSYENDWIRAFIRALPGDGPQVVDCVCTLASENDFYEVTKRWELLGVDTVLILEYYAEDAYFAARQIRKALPNIQMLGDSSFDYQALQTQNAQVIEGLVIPDILPAGEKLEVDAFQKRYLQRFGQLPSRWGAHAYDSVRMIVDTAVQIDSTNPAKIAEALHDAKGYTGVCGVTQFDAGGKMEGNTPQLLVSHNGVFEVLEGE